jgi:hypothetical protein
MQECPSANRQAIGIHRGSVTTIVCDNRVIKRPVPPSKSTRAYTAAFIPMYQPAVANYFAT